MSYDKISSGINSQKTGFNRILEEAASEARRISLAIQKIAGTTSCKGVQLQCLKKWAINNRFWITDIKSWVSFLIADQKTRFIGLLRYLQVPFT